MVADSLGLTAEEVRFARRHSVTPEQYAASKSIHNLVSFEAEMRRRRAKANPDDRGGYARRSSMHVRGKLWAFVPKAICSTPTAELSASVGLPLPRFSLEGAAAPRARTG